MGVLGRPLAGATCQLRQPCCYHLLAAQRRALALAAVWLLPPNAGQPAWTGEQLSMPPGLTPSTLLRCGHEGGGSGCKAALNESLEQGREGRRPNDGLWLMNSV